MKAINLKSLLILWDKQGLFQGDLNRVQQYCKSWVISNEGEERVDLLKIQTLAQNPDMYKAIFEPLAAPEEEEWTTLGGEDLDEESILAEINKWQGQREEL